MDNSQVLELNGIDKVGEKDAKRIYSFFKRTIDVFISLIGIIILIPLTIIVKVLYVITGDFKSVFFAQDRIGKNNIPFKLYKFRTMICGADEKLEELLKKDEKVRNEYNKYKKLENDPRITKIGKILRKTSLDEFPQFINILKGDMSLIGPRPYLYREKKDMGKSFDVIIKVKPGLTGYWQVGGRSNTDFAERLLMDEEYIKKRNLKLDIKIFFKTFGKIFKRDGAK